MKFENKPDYKKYKELEGKKAVFILGYSLGIKACLRALTNIEKNALQDLKLLELAETEGEKVG